MKNIFLALSLIVAAGVTADAQAQFGYSYRGCRLKAELVDTQQSTEAVIYRTETLVGRGVVACNDVSGNAPTRQDVIVTIESLGIGFAANGPVTGLNISGHASGINSTYGMIGSYRFTAGPRLGLIATRYAVLSGMQIAGGGVGSGVEISLEDRYSIGGDFSWATMRIDPAPAPVVRKTIRTRY